VDDATDAAGTVHVDRRRSTGAEAGVGVRGRREGRAVSGKERRNDRHDHDPEDA
jgi:hypothetical protein